MQTPLLNFGCSFLLIFPSAFSARAQAASAEHPNVALDPSVVRTIRDPHNGMLWQLERNFGNPGGPGRMVLLKERAESANDPLANSGERPKKNREAQAPMIRSGDKLVIEEHSALVEARLEAVSLGKAVQGAEFNARLAIGGKVVRAVAISPGRAAFATGAGAQQ